LEWLESNDSLVKTFSFKDFKQAFGFMTKVALLAEKHNHHPWWCNIYNIVEIRLSTHEYGNKITEKDKLLASEIDKL
jgi:4a-hydroxytetrahydrobiopterin dehydratase